jgi:regulator of cell morphogenesis and NO signaling
MLNLDQTVAAIARENPNAVRTFERLHIDFCCGGGRTLREACARANVSLAQLADAIADDTRAELEAPTPAGLGPLIDYILTTHHEFTRAELRRLEALSRKVAVVHGAAHPELTEVARLVVALRDDLLPHMDKEERVLFPFLRALEIETSAGRPPPPAPFGPVANPVRMMNYEHQEVAAILASLTIATRSYALPADACESYRALFDGLKGFEIDLHRHMHLETNVLFPRALSAESGEHPSTVAAP